MNVTLKRFLILVSVAVGVIAFKWVLVLFGVYKAEWGAELVIGPIAAIALGLHMKATDTWSDEKPVRAPIVSPRKEKKGGGGD